MKSAKRERGEFPTLKIGVDLNQALSLGVCACQIHEGGVFYRGKLAEYVVLRLGGGPGLCCGEALGTTVRHFRFPGAAFII